MKNKILYALTFLLLFSNAGAKESLDSIHNLLNQENFSSKIFFFIENNDVRVPFNRAVYIFEHPNKSEKYLLLASLIKNKTPSKFAYTMGSVLDYIKIAKLPNKPLLDKGGDDLEGSCLLKKEYTFLNRNPLKKTRIIFIIKDQKNNINLPSKIIKAWKVDSISNKFVIIDKNEIICTELEME